MKKRYIIAVFFIALAFDVGAFGLSRLQENRFDFSPSFEMTFEYFIEGAEGKDVDIFLNGDLVDYVEVGRIKGTKDERRYFTVHMKLPESLEPGLHSVGVGVRELGSINVGNNAINALVEVISPIKIFVPYHGRYIDVEFITRNANVGEELEFLFRIKSLGDTNISSLRGEVLIYDFDNSFIERLASEEVSLNSFEERELAVNLDLDGYKKGDYLAKGIVYYDGEIKELNNTFRVGDYFIKIVNLTGVLIKDRLNKFDIGIESDWNGVIENVYGVVLIFGDDIRTASTGLNAFESRTLSTYVDANNITIGSHPVNVTLYYGDSESFKEGFVDVREREKGLYEILSPFVLPAMVLVLILLLVFDIMFLRKRKVLYKRKR